MLLENLRLTGFRRFEDPTNVQLSGKLVALTGPNEAGKTSILRALNHFDNSGPIDLGEKTNFFTGKSTIRLSYFLEADDLALADIKVPTWLHYTKLEAGNFEYQFTPLVSRDTTQRINCLRAVQRLKRSVSMRKKIADLGYELTDEEFSKLESILEKSTELSDDELEVIADVGRNFPELSELERLPAYITNFKEAFSNLASFEPEHDPDKTAFEILETRIPTFLFFSSEDREIEVPYDIRLLNHENIGIRRAPSKPLAEIIKMSGLDLAALIRAYAAGHNAGTTGLLTAANEQLRAVSEGIWSQSDACLYFEMDGPMLDLLVENRRGFEPATRYSNLRARSDGYRQFVALHVFTFLHDKEDVVLLIDEIEQHLHYDAQADLIQLLQREPKIKKVIYTTHSAGALPEDLGTGVRLVQWKAEDPKKSTVINRFWKDDEAAGFRPLLFGMGAATFAFFPTRRAVMAEGPTELLLLPRLMREATSSDNLEFQVVHGLANLNLSGFRSLAHDPDNVIFMVDNDKGGRDIRRNLVRSGVSDSKIISLRDVGSFVTVEDLLDPGIWREAVNTYIDKYGAALGAASHVTKVPARGRLKALPEPCAKEKISIAYNILDIVAADPSRRILAHGARSGLAAIVARIHRELAPK